MKTKKMVWVGDLRYDSLSCRSLPEKDEIVECYDFGNYIGVPCWKIVGYDIIPSTGKECWAILECLRDLDYRKGESTEASRELASKLVEERLGIGEEKYLEEEKKFVTDAEF